MNGLVQRRRQHQYETITIVKRNGEEKLDDGVIGGQHFGNDLDEYLDDHYLLVGRLNGKSTCNHGMAISNAPKRSISSTFVLLLLSILILLSSSRINYSSVNNNYYNTSPASSLVECSSSILSIPSSQHVPYQQEQSSALYSKLSTKLSIRTSDLFNGPISQSTSSIQQQNLPSGLDCSYFSNTNNNNNLESCNSLPIEQSAFSTFTIRLTGGTDAIYSTSYPPIIYSTTTSASSSNSKLLINNHHDDSSKVSSDSTSKTTTINPMPTTTLSSASTNNDNDLIPNNHTSYCYQVQKWLNNQQANINNNNEQEIPLSQLSNMCSQFFCNPKDSVHLLIVQEIFSNLSRSLSENSFFPSVVSTQFSIKLTLENSSDSSMVDTEVTTDSITMTIAQLTRLFNYCHYCKVENPSFDLFKMEREEGKCTLPFAMSALKPASNNKGNTNLTMAEQSSDICGQRGYSLPLLNTMTYSSLNDPRLLYYFPYRVCYCYSSSSFSSKCDEWSDLYYTSNFQNGIRGMFIGLYLIQLLVIVVIVLIPLLYKHVRLGTRPALARITTDTSSTHDLQAKLTFDENSYSFKLVSETTPKKTFKQRSRSNSPSVLPILDPSGSDSEDTITTTAYHKYENPPTEKPEAHTPLLNLGNFSKRKRKTNWKRVAKSLLKSIFDFRIIATIISITNLIAGFLSLIPSLPYDARLVLISITCVLSLMGLIPIVFQWLVVLRKIDSQDPNSHSGRHIKALSIVVFTSTVMLFIGYMLTVIFVSGYSSVLLARYIMLVVLFLYFIICFPLLVGYGIKVYFRVLKNNNEIRFFQFKVCFLLYFSNNRFISLQNIYSLKA